MLKNIKLGLGLIKYGFRPKTNIIMCIVIVLIGLAVEFATKGTNMIGAFYMLITAIFVYQMIISMDLSTLVQTSKLKKSLQTSIPAASSFCIYIIVFTIIAIERIILVKIDPSCEADLVSSTLMAMGTMLFAMFYMGICFKFFVLATVLFIGVVMIVSSGATILFMSYDMPIGIGATIGIGYAAIIIGALGQYALSCIFYRKELSKFAFKGLLGKIQ